jgi:DNA-binding XRE family transcriptional regulator
MTEVNGAWMRDWRHRNAYTQDTLALELDVRRQTIIAWEHAPKIERVVFLALKALESDPSIQQVRARRPTARRGP